MVHTCAWLQRSLTLMACQSHHLSRTGFCRLHSFTAYLHSLRKRPYHVVSPGNVSPLRKVPDSVAKPPYADHGPEAIVVPREAEVKTAQQVEGMRRACALAANLLRFTGSYLQVHILFIWLLVATCFLLHH